MHGITSSRHQQSDIQSSSCRFYLYLNLNHSTTQHEKHRSRRLSVSVRGGLARANAKDQVRRDLRSTSVAKEKQLKLHPSQTPSTAPLHLVSLECFGSRIRLHPRPSTSNAQAIFCLLLGAFVALVVSAYFLKGRGKQSEPFLHIFRVFRAATFTSTGNAPHQPRVYLPNISTCALLPLRNCLLRKLLRTLSISIIPL